MSKPKTTTLPDGRITHYSVGAIIKRHDKYLMIERAISPICFAGVAGHIDEGENEIEAIKREVEEESGLIVTSCKLLAEEEMEGNWCSKGTTCHYWYLFDCKVEGEIIKNERETKKVGWFTLDEIKKVNLELVWKYWFAKLRLL